MRRVETKQSKGELKMVKEIKVEKIFKCEICGSLFLTRKEAKECELVCRDEMLAHEDWERELELEALEGGFEDAESKGDD